MIHPLLKKLVTEPSLFVEHASAYGMLAALEARDAGLALRRRAMATLACFSLGLLALIFTGVAVMLAAVVPWIAMPAPWVLVALPALLWVTSGVLWWWATRNPHPQPFTHLRQQWAADTQMARDAAQFS